MVSFFSGLGSALGLFTGLRGGVAAAQGQQRSQTAAGTGPGDRLALDNVDMANQAIYQYYEAQRKQVEIHNAYAKSETLIKTLLEHKNDPKAMEILKKAYNEIDQGIKQTKVNEEVDEWLKD